MPKTLTALVLMVLGLALIAGQPDSDATAAPVATLVLKEGRSVGLRDAGQTPWQGPGMPAGSVSVLCGDGGFAVGRLNDYYFGLNGHTAQWSDSAKVVLPSGTERRLWKPERREFIRVGAITAEADALDFNRPLAAGLQLANQRCAG